MILIKLIKLKYRNELNRWIEKKNRFKDIIKLKIDLDKFKKNRFKNKLIYKKIY